MTTTASPRADQLVAAVMHARRIAPLENKWLVDPDVGDPWTTRAALEAATGRGYFGEAERPDAAPRPVTVNGNAPWPDADDIDDGTESPLALLGQDECGRCLSLRHDVARTVDNVLHVGVGRTVVEVSYCDACAADLDARYVPLQWKVRSGAAV